MYTVPRLQVRPLVSNNDKQSKQSKQWPENVNHAEGCFILDVGLQGFVLRRQSEPWVLPAAPASAAVPAAGRCRVLQLQVGDVGFRSSCLASRMQLDELHTTVQQRVDDLQK